MKNFSKAVYKSKEMETGFIQTFAKHIEPKLKLIQEEGMFQYGLEGDHEHPNHSHLKIFIVCEKDYSTQKIDELLMGDFQMSKTVDEGMKVKDLKVMLNQCDDELGVFINFNGEECDSFEVRHVQNINEEQTKKTEKYVIREK